MKRPAAAIALIWSLASATAAQSPPASTSFSATLTSIKINGRPGDVVTRQFRLTMDPNQPRAHFKAKVEDWWRSEDSRQSFYAEPGTLHRSCARWTSLNPVESAVDPGATLTVRMTIALPQELSPGGYWCALTLDQIPDPLSASESVGVRFVASVSTGIFIYVDPVQRDAQIVDLQIQADEAYVRVRNDGNAPLGIEGRLEFFVPGGRAASTSVQLPRTTVLTEPYREGEISASLPPPASLPPGRYRVRAVLDIGADHDIGAERDIVITRGVQAGGSVR